MAKTMLMKTQWYPRPHTDQIAWSHGLESAAVNQATILPVVMYDEAQGAPSSYSANPRNAAFVTTSDPNCFPNSRINNIIVEMRFNLTKSAIETDKIVAARVYYMPIFTAFRESLQAIDELSQLETQDILELTSETTDRQCYPLWNTVDMKEPYLNIANLSAGVPGLTSGQSMEAVAFDPDLYYNMGHYMTNAGKLKSMNGGLSSFTLTPNRPFRKLRFRMRSKTKRMNEYAFFGILTYVPSVDSYYQYGNVGDTTDVNHINVHATYRYNEWNQAYDFEMV